MKICFVTNTHFAKNNELTTYDLAFAAYEREHEVFLITVLDFSSMGNDILGKVKVIKEKGIKSRKELVEKIDSYPTEKIKLSALDVLFLRHKYKSYQKIPEAYHKTVREYAFHLSESGVKVFNDPKYLPFVSSKIATMGLDKLILPEHQLVSNDFEELQAFCKDILNYEGVMKNLHGSGGDDVFFIDKRNIRNNLNSLLRKSPVVVQSYIKNEGDKRILLLNGDPIAWYMRVAQEGEGLHNIHAGAKPVACDLTERDLKIIDVVKPKLKKCNMLFVGIDTLGGYLSEINSENPGGTVRADYFGKFNSREKVIEFIESKIKK